MQQPKKNFKIVPEKRSARVILPNMLTLIGVCIGLTSIRFALDGRYEFAIIAIIIAAVIDGLDGRIARLIKGTSKVGKELDSLTDMISFGVAPALPLLIKSNKKKPLQADTLNYLGFTTRKLGDYENGEKYYLLGLEIDPNHKGINEYLGELYVATNRMDLAKERLKVLETCNCEEYNELKEIIEGTKKSKY